MRFYDVTKLLYFVTCMILSFTFYILCSHTVLVIKIYDMDYFRKKYFYTIICVIYLLFYLKFIYFRYFLEKLISYK